MNHTNEGLVFNIRCSYCRDDCFIGRWNDFCRALSLPVIVISSIFLLISIVMFICTGIIGVYVFDFCLGFFITYFLTKYLVVQSHSLLPKYNNPLMLNLHFFEDRVECFYDEIDGATIVNVYNPSTYCLLIGKYLLVIAKNTCVCTVNYKLLTDTEFANMLLYFASRGKLVMLDKRDIIINTQQVE